MKIVTLEMPDDRAQYLVGAIHDSLLSWSSDMEADEINALKSILSALKGQLDAT